MHGGNTNVLQCESGKHGIALSKNFNNAEGRKHFYKLLVYGETFAIGTSRIDYRL